ncbi:MAG TPA: hypothetical protein PKA88_33460 [Polyangiaceae bacterium]|nr:hypothetical protein [Polyangiaceae bacterium]HMR76735.1 hypothetical protein [Polyangiaceae bacterium]
MNPVTTSYLVWVYGVYAVIALVLTIWLARTLFQNGAVFLADVFADKPALAEAVNRLLVVGFYLFNFGYACLLLKSYDAPTVVSAIELLATKLGWLLVSLATMHFFNMYLFHRIRRRALAADLPPPVLPHAQLEPHGRAAHWDTLRHASAVSR